MPEEYGECIGIESARDAIRVDVDEAISALDEHLHRAVGDAPIAPAEALECLCYEVVLGPVVLLFNSGRHELECLLDDLRHLQGDFNNLFGSAVAESLARAAVELHPLVAAPTYDLFRSGAMGILRERGSLLMFADTPVCVPVRGAETAGAERKLAWLLSQMAVIRLPDHLRPERAAA